jgi:hypothetical protein
VAAVARHAGLSPRLERPVLLLQLVQLRNAPPRLQHKAFAAMRHGGPAVESTCPSWVRLYGLGIRGGTRAHRPLLISISELGPMALCLLGLSGSGLLEETGRRDGSFPRFVSRGDLRLWPPAPAGRRDLARGTLRPAGGTALRPACAGYTATRAFRTPVT